MRKSVGKQTLESPRKWERY